MVVKNPRGLYQAVCTKWMYEGSMFFSVIPISEYDGTAKMRTDHDAKIVAEFTGSKKFLEEYIDWMDRPHPRGANTSGLSHEDMGTILVMTVKE